MDMLEDYLRAVSRLLPKAKRDDITAELRDEILTRIEVREGELGRTLSDDETEQLLRDFGHPIVVAARYRDGPQYCVGPALYPFWAFAVRIAVMIEVCLSVLVFLGRVFSGGHAGDAFGAAIGAGLSGVMTLIGFATVAAWVIERKGITIDYFNTWRVRDLRFLDFAAWEWSDMSGYMDTMKVRRDGAWNWGQWNWNQGSGAPWMRQPSSAGRGVAAIVAGAVFILWWIGALSFGLKAMPVDFSVLNVDPGRLGAVDFAAFKTALFWPVLVYFALLMGLGGAMLIYPRGVRLRGAMDMALGLCGLGVSAWIWTASPIAEAVRVESVNGLVARIGAFLGHPLPLPLELLVTVFLITVTFSALCRALGGLWELIAGAPRYPGEG